MMSSIEEVEFDDLDLEEYENLQLNRLRSMVENRKQDINQVLVHGLTCLHSVAESARMSRALIQWGIHIDVLDNLGQTPLMHAVRSKHLRAIKAILMYLEDGSDINIRDLKGNGAVDHAINNLSHVGMFGVAKMVKQGARRSHCATATNQVLVDYYNNLLILVTMCIPLCCKRASKSIWICVDMIRMLKNFLLSPYFD